MQLVTQRERPDAIAVVRGRFVAPDHSTDLTFGPAGMAGVAESKIVIGTDDSVLELRLIPARLPLRISGEINRLAVQFDVVEPDFHSVAGSLLVKHAKAIEGCAVGLVTLSQVTRVRGVVECEGDAAAAARSLRVVAHLPGMDGAISKARL